MCTFSIPYTGLPNLNIEPVQVILSIYLLSEFISSLLWDEIPTQIYFAYPICKVAYNNSKTAIKAPFPCISGTPDNPSGVGQFLIIL